MAKKYQTVKEISQIVIFLLVVGLLLTAFVIYPLNRTKAVMGRADIDEFNPDSLPANDPTAFVEAGLLVDTFYVEPSILTRLACLRISPQPPFTDSVRGTVLLLHDERQDRTSMLPLSALLSDSGFSVIVYDQRGVGLSSNKYRGEGQYEASDLEEVISYLDIRGRAIHPLAVIGRGIGAEAGMLASADEERIDKVVAIDPYLTTNRMLDIYRAEYDMYWLPFFRGLFWWWYNIRSGNAAPIRTIDDIKPVSCQTLVLAPDSVMSAPEFARLGEVSDTAKLDVRPLPDDDAALADLILQFLRR